MINRKKTANPHAHRAPVRRNFILAGLATGVLGLGAWSFFRKGPQKPSESSPTTSVPADLQKRAEAVIGEVYEYLEMDPQLQSVLTNVLDISHPRLRFELVAQAESVARDFNITNWAGNAFTVGVARKNAAGVITQAHYVVYLEGNLLADVAQALRTIHHEFYHVLRIETSRVLPDREAEEVPTYTESMAGLKSLIQAIRDKSLKATGAAKEKLEKLANDLTLGLAEEARMQASFLRTPR